MPVWLRVLHFTNLFHFSPVVSGLCMKKKNRLFLASAAAVITRPTFCKRRTGDYIQKKNPLEWPIQDDATRIKGRWKDSFVCGSCRCEPIDQCRCVVTKSHRLGENGRWWVGVFVFIVTSLHRAAEKRMYGLLQCCSIGSGGTQRDWMTVAWSHNSSKTRGVGGSIGIQALLVAWSFHHHLHSWLSLAEYKSLTTQLYTALTSAKKLRRSIKTQRNR